MRLFKNILISLSLLISTLSFGQGIFKPDTDPNAGVVSTSVGVGGIGEEGEEATTKTTTYRGIPLSNYRYRNKSLNPSYRGVNYE